MKLFPQTRPAKSYCQREVALRVNAEETAENDKQEGAHKPDSAQEPLIATGDQFTFARYFLIPPTASKSGSKNCLTKTHTH